MYVRYFSRSDWQGFWPIAWAELLCIQFICHRHMTHHLNYGYQAWTKATSVVEQQQQTGAASAKVSVNAARQKRGHWTLWRSLHFQKWGLSPELKLIKAPVLETSMWATAEKTICHTVQHCGVVSAVKVDCLASCYCTVQSASCPFFLAWFFRKEII